MIYFTVKHHLLISDMIRKAVSDLRFTKAILVEEGGVVVGILKRWCLDSVEM